MLIDSHCHIPHRNYELPLETLLSEAKSQGVEKFISIGTSLEDLDSILKIVYCHPEIFPTIGIYPHEDLELSLREIQDSLYGKLREFKKYVAMGECGLDISNWRGGRSLKDQLELFELQLSLALENHLPVVVHNRNADDLVYDLLKRFSKKGVTGVMHCYSSNWEYALKILNLGFKISFSGMITYPKKESLLEVVRKVPMEGFLLETDSPYLSPQSLRGQVNYPKCVKIVAEKVAETKQKSLSEVEAFSYTNTCNLFGI